jgi:hypothetical protein
MLWLPPSPFSPLLPTTAIVTDTVIDTPTPYLSILITHFVVKNSWLCNLSWKVRVLLETTFRTEPDFRGLNTITHEVRAMDLLRYLRLNVIFRNNGLLESFPRPQGGGRNPVRAKPPGISYNECYVAVTVIETL